MLRLIILIKIDEFPPVFIKLIYIKSIEDWTMAPPTPKVKPSQAASKITETE